jgi:hypothetical protein
MKKVRYALATPGLVPATAAVCTPLAMAATAREAPVNTAKTVSARLHTLAQLSTRWHSRYPSHYQQRVENPNSRFSIAVHRPYPGLPHVRVAGKSWLYGTRDTFYCAHARG